MDVSLSTVLNDIPAPLRQAGPARSAVSNPLGRPAVATTDNLPVTTDFSSKPGADGTRLIDETREDTVAGYRKTSVFEKTDGRRFTRIEDFSFTPQGAKRTIVQQNPSGSVTRYDEVLDREEDGEFRRTQRFQDGAGDVVTKITTDYQVTDPFILSGGGAFESYGSSPPFTPLRGTQLDLQA